MRRDVIRFALETAIILAVGALALSIGVAVGL